MKSNSSILKTMSVASYSAKRVGEMNRETALKTLVNRTEYYDIKGELIEYKTFGNNGILYEQTKLKRNEKGTVVQGTTLDSEGNIKRYWSIKLGIGERVEEMNTFEPNHKLIRAQLYKYDNKGNKIEMKIGPGRTEYEYNSINQLTKEKYFDLDRNTTETRIFSYDKMGNKTEELLVHNDGNKVKFINEYDGLNNLIVQKWINEEGEEYNKTEFNYTYDAFSNWLTKKRIFNGELGMVWERQIEYY